MAVEQADIDFFDELYQLWSKTTGTGYWLPQEYVDGTGRWKLYAVDYDDKRQLVASELREADAEFIAGMHGALPELIRLLHSALDEADRADCERDSQWCRIGELELELIDLKRVVQGLSQDPPWGRHE